MGRVLRATNGPTRVLPAPVPLVMPDSCADPNPVGTTYEMCLASEDDDPRLLRQFRRLVQTIVAQFPPDLGGTIFLTGVGSSSHVADVAGAVARHLTTTCHGGVILVDADAADRVLTQRFAADTEKGLAEALQEGTPSTRLAVATAVPHMTFLAAGAQLASRRVAPTAAVYDLVKEWKAAYRYSVINAGTKPSALTSPLARCCDATYLVVQLGHAGRQQTVDLARHLTAAGARLLGSVATGVRG